MAFFVQFVSREMGRRKREKGGGVTIMSYFAKTVKIRISVISWNITKLM